MDCEHENTSVEYTNHGGRDIPFRICDDCEQIINQEN